MKGLKPVLFGFLSILLSIYFLCWAESWSVVLSVFLILTSVIFTVITILMMHE